MTYALRETEAVALAKAAAAARSTDKDTQVGALLLDEDGKVLIVEANRLTRGIEINAKTTTRLGKYPYTEHAERNVIYAAAARGIETRGRTMVCTWFPCEDCARAIVASEIETLICSTPDLSDEKRGESWQNALEILEAAGVIIDHYDS